MSRPSIWEKIVDPTARIKKVRIDASTACQLKCRVCDTASGKMKETVVGWGYLKFSNFRKFVDENPQIKQIELSNCGEIFLNPEIGKIIEYSHQKGVELNAGNGVNLNTVKETDLEAVVKYQFNFMSVSIDGACQDTYSIYRVGGDFDTVISNIKKINHYKKKYNSKYPKLQWQFIVFGHNEHEITTAKQMASDLDMSFNAKMNSDPSYSPVKNVEMVKKKLGLRYTSRHEHEIRRGYAFSVPCHQMWQQPQINYDGKLLGCCINFKSDYGNVFEDGFRETLKGEKYTYAKKMLLGKKPPRADIPCVKCSKYHKVKNLRTGRLKKDYLQKEREKLNIK